MWVVVLLELGVTVVWERECVLFWLVEGRLRRCGVCVGAGLRLGGAVMGVARA